MAGPGLRRHAVLPATGAVDRGEQAAAFLIELFVDLRVGSAQKTHILSHNPPTICLHVEPASPRDGTRIANKRSGSTVTNEDVLLDHPRRSLGRWSRTVSEVGRGPRRQRPAVTGAFRGWMLEIAAGDPSPIRLKVSARPRQVCVAQRTLGKRMWPHPCGWRSDRLRRFPFRG
jgi:hypothetical protein